jgi:nucleotide-binding universal stress UspA family protein
VIDFLVGFPLPPDTEFRVVTVIKSVLHEDELMGLSEEQQREIDEAQKAEEQEAEQLLVHESERLREAGQAGSTDLRHGNPAEEIIHAADQFAADLIAVGSHGISGIRKFLLGSVSDHVLESASCSVLIVKGPVGRAEREASASRAAEHKRWHLLLAYDNSAPARKAVDLCASLPLHEAVEVNAITVLPLVRMFRQDIRQQLSWVWQEKKKAARNALERVTREVRWATPNVTTEVIEAPDTSEAILDAGARMDSDLIVVGHKGKSAVRKFLLGSVTSRVAHHASCSVLAVRAGSP